MIIHVISVLCLLCFHAFIDALSSPAGKGLTSWLSFVMSNCEFVTSLDQMWYLIVSIPEFCPLSYFSKYIFKLAIHVFIKSDKVVSIYRTI